VVQETVISVAKNIEGFHYDPAVCSFKRWMLQVTRWRIINQVHKRRHEPGVPASAGPATGASGRSDESDHTATVERIADPAAFPLESVWDQEWEKHLLAAALEQVKRQVDPAQFQLFDLYCLESWPAHKVARTLGVNVGRVYLAKHRVGRLLKQKVQSLKRTFE
jgi:RNA polymerase sigma-70 factor (ECF subfamily)